MPRRPRRTNDETPAAMDAVTSSEAGKSNNSPESTLDSSVSSQSPDLSTLSASSDASPTEAGKDSAKVRRAPRPRARRAPAGHETPDGEAVVAKSASDTISDADSQPDAGAPRRRRPGGRRTSSLQTAETTAITDQTDASDSHGEQSTESEDSAAGDTPDGAGASTRSRRSRRGGRRRRGGRDGADGAVSGNETIESEGEIAGLIAIESDGTGEIASADESEAGAPPRSRARRPGRGGRRSKGDVDQEGSADRSADSVDQTELSLPIARVRDTWRAPALVPSISELHLEPFELGITAALHPNGWFEIDGKIVSPHLFFVNAEGAGENQQIVSNQIRRASDAGIHLHTVVVYLPLKNAHGERSFVQIDRAIQTVLNVDADARIVLRIQCVPTNFWVRMHPDQICRYNDGSEGDVSISSSEFWEDCVLAIDALLRRLADPETPGNGRVFAVHLDKGEWFHEPGAGYDYSLPSKLAFRGWLREQYQTLYALRAAWFDGKVTFDTADIPQPDVAGDSREECVLHDQPKDRRHVDYLTFASAIVGNVLTQLAKAVKELTAGKLLVFAPYGYLFEFASRNGSGHQALGAVLNSPDINVLTGPNSYTGRAAGAVGGFASPVDSVALHNKLWIVEDDTKTYLAPDDTPDTYNPHIAGQQETIMVHRRNHFSAIAHGCGISWMDLWGQGWLDSDSIWEEIKTGLDLFKILTIPEGFEENPEVAVLIDEASYAWVRGGAGGQRLQHNLIAKARDLMARAGASVRYYLQSDLHLLAESVKVVFFLNALRVSTQERISIREKLQRQGRTIVWVYAPGLYDENGPTPAEISEIVGMPLKSRAWHAKVGTIFTDDRHPVIERLHGGKRMGTEDTINPSFTTIDPQAVVLGEYAATGEPSVALKAIDTTWRSIFVGEPHLTGELIRGIFRYAGVHLFDIQDDIVAARADGFLMIHAPYTGQRVIHLPSSKACYSLSENRLLAKNSSSVRHFMRGRSTHALLWGEIEDIARRIGRSVDDLEASIQIRAASDSHRRDQRDENSEDFENGDTGSEYRTEQDIEIDGEGDVDNPGSANDQDNQDPAVRARIEATLVTQAVLAEEIVISPEIESQKSVDDDSDGGSSSRRRRWRRRGQDANSSGTPNNPPSRIPIVELIGDLLGRRKPKPDTSKE